MPAPPSRSETERVGRLSRESRSTSHASESNRASNDRSGNDRGGGGNRSTSHASAANRAGDGGGGGGLIGGSYGSYNGPSRYGSPGQGSQGYRSLVNAANAIGGSPQDIVSNVLRNMGLGYGNPYGLAGMLGTFGHESGYNPNALGDAGTAYGLAQWRGDRLDSLNDYVQRMGLSPDDIGAQAAFAGQELATNYPSAYSGVTGAGSIPDAVAAMNAYERPRGWKPGGNPANVAGWNDRLARAENLYSASAPSALASMSAGSGPGAGALASLGSGAASTPSYPDAPQGSWLGTLGGYLGSGLQTAKQYGQSYMDKAKSPENIKAFAKADPFGAMKLASAFGRTSRSGVPGQRHAGEGGRGYTPVQNEQFKSKLAEYVKKTTPKAKKSPFIFETPKTNFPRYSQANWLKGLRLT